LVLGAFIEFAMHDTFVLRAGTITSNHDINRKFLFMRLRQQTGIDKFVLFNTHVKQK